MKKFIDDNKKAVATGGLTLILSLGGWLYSQVEKVEAKAEAKIEKLDAKIDTQREKCEMLRTNLQTKLATIDANVESIKEDSKRFQEVAKENTKAVTDLRILLERIAVRFDPTIRQNSPTFGSPTLSAPR